MRVPIPKVALAILAVLSAAGCSDPVASGSLGADPPPNDAIRAAAIALDVDLVRGTVAVSPASSRSPSASGLSYAIVGGNEVEAEIGNVVVTPSTGTFFPRTQVSFDLTLHNRLAGSSLLPATWPELPDGVDQIVAFPFATEPTSLFGLNVRANHEWNGTGEPGSGSPWNFFNDGFCILLTPPGDCYRWEAFGPVLPPLASQSRRVGFDVAPSITNFTLYVLVTADVEHGGTAAPTGVIGTLSSPELGLLADIPVQVGETETRTSAAGYFIATGLEPGQTTVRVGGLRPGCVVPPDHVVTLVAGELVDASAVIACPGNIIGEVSSEEEGPLADVHVIATQGSDERSTTTDEHGHYELRGLTPGPWIVGLAGLPSGCLRPLDRDVTGVAGEILVNDYNVTCVGERVLDIVFETSAGLSVMKLDGTGRVDLPGTFEGARPAWSSDGLRIAYNADDVGSFAIATYELATQARTIEHPNHWGIPQWFPNGQQLVLANAQGSVGRPEGELTRYTLTVFGGPTFEPLATRPNGEPVEGVRPTVSPNGDIAFIPGQTTVSPVIDQLIAATNYTTSRPIVIDGGTPFTIRQIRYSPNGEFLVFELHGPSYGVFVRRADGTGSLVQLTDEEQDSHPVYSPDGTTIYFLRSNVLHAMSSDGFNIREPIPGMSLNVRSFDIR